MGYIIFVTFLRMEWNERPFKINIKLLFINHITFRNKHVFIINANGACDGTIIPASLQKT
jgi:hypothetical protein